MRFVIALGPAGGKFRPYLLFGAIPFALIGMLTFTTPGFGPTGTLIYAYVTYGIMMMVYTTVNVPYAALMGVMTPNTEERTSLASWRFIGAYAGGILVTATAGSLIEYFGRGAAMSPFRVPDCCCALCRSRLRTVLAHLCGHKRAPETFFG